MIRKNTINFNLIQLKKSKRSSLSLFDASMTSFRSYEETCPYCHRKGDCRIHAYYDRFLVDFIGGRPVAHRLRITRVRCSCCRHTHAVLPDPLIPYDHYSLVFILHVLKSYFRRNMSISDICNLFMIDARQIYRWKALYLDHWREWHGLLRSAATEPLHSLAELSHYEPFSHFARFFFRKTGITFMQTHRNPALYGRNASLPRTAQASPHNTSVGSFAIPGYDCLTGGKHT